MKLISILSLFILFSCATHKNQSKTDIQNMTVAVEIIVNNMPSTDDSSQNYAILTLNSEGDTLKEAWSVFEFTLKDENGVVLQEQSEIPAEFKGKGKTQAKYNVRNLPATIPSIVIVDVIMETEGGSRFSTTTDPIHLTIVE